MTENDHTVAVPSLIGVDWGSSRLRAYAISAGAEVIDSAESGAGILRTPRENLAGALSTILSPWLERWPEVPVIASGMIGSRTGLREVPYLGLPAGIEDIRRAMVPVPVAPAHLIAIVPGLICRGDRGVDVLRGEETPLLGWLSLHPREQRRTVILPGTHNKWVRVAAGKIRDFCTFPTGELYDSLLHSGSLKDLSARGAGTDDPVAFDDGLKAGLAAKGLLNDYFSIRARAVTDDARGVPDFLSGMLIGYEIAEARSRSILDSLAPVVVIGQGLLAQRYAVALQSAGIPYEMAGAECLRQGWLALAEEPAS